MPVQGYPARFRRAMIKLQDSHKLRRPSNFIDTLLMPPMTDEKAFTQASQVISLFKDIQVGRHDKELSGGHEDGETAILRHDERFGRTS